MKAWKKFWWRSHCRFVSHGMRLKYPNTFNWFLVSRKSNGVCFARDGEMKLLVFSHALMRYSSEWAIYSAMPQEPLVLETYAESTNNSTFGWLSPSVLSTTAFVVVGNLLNKQGRFGVVKRASSFPWLVKFLRSKEISFPLPHETSSECLSCSSPRPETTGTRWQ